MKKIVAYILAAFFMLFSVGTVCASEGIYIYQAKIINYEADSIRLSLTNNSRAKPIILNFKRGLVSLKSYYSAQNVTEGKEAYMSVPDGEEFLFTCALNLANGEITVSINGEECLSAVYGIYKGITPTPVWFLNATMTEACESSAVSILEDENFYADSRPQTVSIAESDTAGISLSFNAPVSYSELKKIKVTDENEENIDFCDLIKEKSGAVLKFKSKVKTGAEYHVSAAEICDIYGRSFSFSQSFTPQTEGTLSVGKNITLSEEMSSVLDFEAEKKWRTEADLLGENPDMKLEDLAIEYYSHDGTYEEQSYAAPLTAEYKNSGNYSIKWENHPFYSTLSTKFSASDWTGANVLKLWLYSEKKTDETVMLTIYSDNENTPWRDGYTYPLLIDFAGEKELTVPFEDFYKFNEPSGFDNVTAVYFAAKMFELTPNPETVLYIDNIRVLYDENYMITPQAKIYAQKTENHRAEVYDRSLLNHNFSEVQKEALIDTEENTYIHYGAYYKTERALYGYYPRYAPAVPSFDCEGNAYILKNGVIQYLTDEGIWKTVDLEPIFLKLFPHHGFNFGIYDQMFSDETVIRFDTSGGVYVALTVYEQAYLLYSPDGMLTWQGYYLLRETGVTSGTGYLRFERIEGNNTEAAEKPPAFLLSGATVGTCHLVIPEKTAEGKLTFNAVTYAQSAIAPASHSGDGNVLISVGDNIYVVYGKYAENLTDEEKSALPDENSAANALSWTKNGNTYYSKNGTPAFIRRYDRKTGELSAPVFAGYGGMQADSHNWPNITVDSEKRLHVLVNGHHNPIYYSHTLNSDDISSWSDPILFGSDDSYASLLTDKNDTIYVVTRDSGRGYRFDLTLYKKAKGETEFTDDYLVQRLSSHYEVWRNRMSIDPTCGKIYINYYSQSSHTELFKERYDTYLYTWPHLERLFLKQHSEPPSNSNTTKYKWYATTNDDSGREGVILVSSDSGKTFTLAETSDFSGQMKPYADISEAGFTENGVEVRIVSSYKNAEASVLLGIYEEDKLEKVLKKQITLSKGTNNSITFENVESNKKIKAFLWGDELNPYSPPKEAEGNTN